MVPPSAHSSHYVKRPRVLPVANDVGRPISANPPLAGQVPRCVSAEVNHRSTPVPAKGERVGDQGYLHARLGHRAGTGQPDSA
jgi:hypothetical protein